MSREAVKRGTLSRADIAEAKEQAGESAAAFVADQLGLVSAAPPDVQMLESTDVLEVPSTESEQLRSPAPEPEEIPPSDRPHPNQARVRFWCLDRREIVKSTPPPKPSKLQALSEAFWDEPPSQSAPYQLLAEPAAWMQRLLHVLNDERTTRDPDLPRVVETLGRSEVVREIPYAQRRALGRHLHVIDDRHLHLTPYWVDHQVFASELFRRLPDYTHSRSVLVSGQSEPQAPLRKNADDSNPEGTLPPADSVVVAFTDLGALARSSETQRRAWRGITRRLLARGCRLIAITPARWRDTDAQLAAQWELLPWDAAPERNRAQAVDRQAAAEKLFDLLAPAIRIEPGLLRAARMLLVRRGESMDAGVEAVAWQHSALASRHSVAATMTADARRRGLKAFREIDPELRSALLEKVRQWRRVETLVTPQVWLEELIALDAAGLELEKSFSSDLTQARDYFSMLNHQLRAEDGKVVLERKTAQWFQRLESRWRGMGADPHSDADKLIHQISQALPRTPGDPPPLVYDPEQQPRPVGEIVTMALYQTGQRIVARPHIEAEIAPHGLSPLGLIEATREQSSGWVRLYWEARDESNDGIRLRDHVELEADSAKPQMVLRIPSGAKRLLVRSDHETLQFRQDEKPEWADAYGRDCYGLWADWSYKGVTQRFRWIPPGSFWMGSPKEEAGSYGDEDQHHVTLSQGFWLGETTVTQKLWQAVVGMNPSYFKGDNRPVERVSAEDVYKMIRTLNAKGAGQDEKFMLPSEAQWKYACRAGTRGVFKFEGELTLQKIGYHGSWLDAWGDGARQGTAPVASYPPNAWGLFEMNGNVREWCRDGWKSSLGTKPATNPVTPAASGADRVLRGGSWILDAGDTRSASQLAKVRGYRYVIIGFRLARGHIESGAGGAGQ